MTGLLARLEAVFLAPSERAQAPPPVLATRHAELTLAVVAPAGRARSLGAAVAMAASGRGIALVACWRCARRAGPRVPAAPAAARLVRSLGTHDIAAAATGRLVVAELPDAEARAVEALSRCEALAPQAVTLALGGARDAGWDGWLRSCDRVLVTAHDTETAALAADRLSERGVAASTPAAWPAATARRLALAGLVLPGTLSALRPEGVAA